MKKKEAKSPSLVPAKPEMTLHTDASEYLPGESVDAHANLEVANELIGRKEIGQQHNNL
ncbi:hypothetical protein [Bacillus sp. FJAT-27231]|uniref:hypothetical protein n=1 Tax=Bacillus sp. FJAT-27231 TaxID=1679168 RepID=UPI000AF9E35B|nr:hypothetical protein [Bacillus sp. FJAT-27231]